MIVVQVADRAETDLAQQVVYAISHDLRAPTRHIHAFVEILSKHLEGQLDDAAAGYLARLSGAADVFEHKLEALTRYSRVVTQGIEPRCYSAAEAVSEALVLLEVQIADTGTEIVVEALPMVVADPAQLVTVFHELIGNSLKFCPGGSSIRITAKPSEFGSIITVADNGPGFGSQNAGSAFELFRRFHPNSIPGTGTGLAIVDRIVKRHGGRITIDSGESCGARIELWLPAATDLQIAEVPDA